MAWLKPKHCNPADLDDMEQDEKEFVARMSLFDPAIRKTSHEWYLMMPWKRMCDPDGWRTDIAPKDQDRFWHKEPITWAEFSSRYWKCTMVSWKPVEPIFAYGKSLSE